MMYEFITPSDPITFVANDDKVAYYCAVILGNGKAFCKSEDDRDIPTGVVFYGSPEEAMIAFLGSDLNTFFDANRKSIADCFRSFAYTKFSDRKQYDAAVEAITDKEKLKEFRDKHDDIMRSSMSEWVKYAWALAEKIDNPAKSEKDNPETVE